MADGTNFLATELHVIRRYLKRNVTTITMIQPLTATESKAIRMADDISERAYS
jgi:hypothetical protein